MGISCSKQYTLKINSGASDLLAYWKCEESDNATELVDSVAGRIFTATSLPAYRESGKIGYGTRIGGDTLNRYEFYTDNSLPTSTYNLAGGDFTFRCWVKPFYSAGSYQIFSGGNAHPWELWYRNYDGVNDTYLVWEIKGVGIVYVMECWVPVTHDAWHHVAGWYERGVGAGMRVDSDNVDTFPETALMASADQTLFMGGTTAGNIAIDEIAIWTRKLSSAEIAHDYNSGSGRTYPSVP